MKRLVGLLLVGLLVAVGAQTAAAEECCNEDGINWSFGMSTSYAYDFNSPDAPPLSGIGNEAAYPSLEQDESFNIDLVQLGATGARGAFGFGVKIDYGDLARLAGDSDDGDIALQEAYISYSGDGVGGTAGRISTPIGYEVLEPWGNVHPTRSYTWLAQPINHDGLTINGTADIVDLMVGVVNSFSVADQEILANDIDDEKGVIAALGAGVSDAFNLYVAGIYTEEDDNVDIGAVNGIISGDLPIGDSSLGYAVEGYWRRDNPDGGGADDMWSVVGYLNHQFGDGPFSLGTRVEYIDDEGVLLPDTNVWAVSPTVGVELVDGVNFRVEYRFEKADDDVFLDDSSGDDKLHVISAQLVWNPQL
jgi:hypothetical protein